MIKHYAEILYPGIICSDTLEREVKDQSNFKLPKDAFGYRFFDREVVVTAGEELTGKKKNFSGWHFKGKEYSATEIKNEFPNEDILISNLNTNNIKRVVKTFQGQFIPMEKNDTVFD